MKKPTRKRLYKIGMELYSSDRNAILLSIITRHDSKLVARLADRLSEVIHTEFRDIATGASVLACQLLADRFGGLMCMPEPGDPIYTREMMYSRKGSKASGRQNRVN